MFGDNNTKYFQLMATISKRKTLYGKSWMNMIFGTRTKILFCRFYRKEFSKRFKNDLEEMSHNAIPLSKHYRR